MAQVQHMDQKKGHATAWGIIGSISFSHFLNDMMQSILLAIYPVLKLDLNLSFAQVGLISLAYQVTASLLQPVIGLYTDHKPKPYSLPVSMILTMTGLIALGTASQYEMVLVAAVLIGMGSSIFHPESSRVARLAAGKRPGLSQSLFQVGGNLGSAAGPLIAIMIILPQGTGSIVWFSAVALFGAIILTRVSNWYNQHLLVYASKPEKTATRALSNHTVWVSLGVLALLVFSKFIYMASFTNYYTFYLIDKFHLSMHYAQLYLFAFLFAVATGTILGGPIGDALGRKKVIWGSILGVAPLTMLLPYANLFWTAVLSVLIGIVVSSAFSAILVFAQELVPGRVGAISGLFFGLAFGIAGVGAVFLGNLADTKGIQYVYHLCAFLPLIGIVTIFLPDIKE